MSTLNDGERYDPNDPDQHEYLRKAKCYIDRTVNPPMIRVIKDDNGYEIIGWVWQKKYGELKVNGVDVKLGDNKKYFIYKNKKVPPGVYYLVRKNGREKLVRDKFFNSINEFLKSL